MSKYTFKCEHHDGSIITIETNKDCLPEIVEEFRNFLIGATFDPDSVAQYLMQDEYNGN